jgi:hypothetical protein
MKVKAEQLLVSLEELNSQNDYIDMAQNRDQWWDFVNFGFC